MRWPFFKAGSLFPANAIGVDLGTANTLIYVKGEGIVLNEPSVVAIDRESKQIKGVGLEAKRMLGRTPEGVIAVRPMKDGVIADFDVTEKMLRYFLKTIIDKHVFRVKPKVIVAVPSGITEVERRAVRDSAETAGAKQVLMVAEPVPESFSQGPPATSWPCKLAPAVNLGDSKPALSYTTAAEAMGATNAIAAAMRPELTTG
jgi:rod shape-determining protein MreB